MVLLKFYIEIRFGILRNPKPDRSPKLLNNAASVRKISLYGYDDVIKDLKV